MTIEKPMAGFSVGRRCGLFGLLVVLALTAGLGAHSASGKSLDEVVRQALSTNPRIAALAKSREAIGRELRQARGNYLPQIDLTVGFGKERSDTLTTRGLGVSGSFYSRQEAQLQIIQRLFDGSETESAVERQRQRVLSAANRVAEDAEMLGLDVASVYLEVLRQRSLKTLAEKNVNYHVKVIGSLREREGQGGGNVGDVTQAEGRLARARATVLQVINDLQDAEAVFRRLTGEMPDGIEEPKAALDLLPRNLEQALDLVRANNPTVRVFDSDIRVAQQELEGANSSYYPKVNLEATASRNETFDGTSGPERSYQAMLRMRWNLFRGGSDSAAKGAVYSRLATAQAQRDNALIDAEERMKKAWNGMDINRQKIDLYKLAIKHNAATLSTYKQQFELLIRTLLDVLDAENELFNSESLLVSSNIAATTSAYRVLALSGRLLPTLGVSLPEQASTRLPTFREQVAP